ncbi:MAG: TlpA family protein disulfide reductase [Bacillota bacterium]
MNKIIKKGVANIKKIIAIFFIILLLLSFIVGSVINIILTKDQSTTSQQSTLPAIKLKNLSDKNKSLTKLSSPTIILFYLPQSTSCQQQLEILSKFDKNQNKTTILTVAIGDVKTNKLQNLKQKNNFKFKFLIDTKAQLTEKLGISAIPTLVFYHPQQEIKLKEGLTNEKEFKKYFPHKK